MGDNPYNKSVWLDLDDEIDQIWAEAVLRWRLGESLYLIGDIEAEAKIIQEKHREISIMEGLIPEFLDKPVPEDFQKWTLEKRLIFLNGKNTTENEKLVLRNKICALEV